MPTTLLAGLRVLEFSHTIMGPTAGMLLADLGADVVKVEPTEGDHTRRLTGIGSGFFAAMNRNKRGLALDLKSSEGQAVLHRLIPGTDVVMENYGPGTMERLGCGYEQLAPLNDRLIYLALKGYLAGPYEHRPALDEVVQFHTGLAYMLGPPGRPLRAGASVIDIMGGMFGVIGLMAALRERERTGKGQRVGSALFESAAFLMSTHMAGIAATGQDLPPLPGRPRATWAIYQVFDTADNGHLFVGVTSDQQWARFVKEFSLEKLAADPRLATNAMRVQERDWLIPALQEAFAKLTMAEASQRCERANISWAPVGKPSDLFTDPHLLASGGLLNILVPRAGTKESVTAGLPALPLEFGLPRQRPGLTSQPPRLGEHSRAVLAEAGFTPAEIEALCAKGTVVGSGAEKNKQVMGAHP
jgi:crotonobetainyl-CoA:carnitine CoA-transferase CaiB-like acyl-CoA transferase